MLAAASNSYRMWYEDNKHGEWRFIKTCCSKDTALAPIVCDMIINTLCHSSRQATSATRYQNEFFFQKGLREYLYQKLKNLFQKKFKNLQFKKFRPFVNFLLIFLKIAILTFSLSQFPIS